MAREISPRLSRLLSDDAYAQAEYDRVYGGGRKPLSDLKPDYRRRILNALAEGKTRQQARGHTPRGGVSEYQRRLARIDAEYGVTPSQLTSLRKLARQSDTPWEDVQRGINRSDAATVRFALKRKIQAMQAFKQGDKTVGQSHMADRKMYLPIAFYWYHGRI